MSGLLRCCPVCDADRAQLLYDNPMAAIDDHGFGYPVVACTGCGAVYAQRVLAQASLQRYYRDLSKYDDAGAASDLDRQRARLAARFVAGVTDARGTLLDIGCSTGTFLDAAIAAGLGPVAGIDPAPGAVAVARQRGLDVQLGSAETHVDPARYDVLTLLAVLEHLREPARYLQTLARRMASGAVLVIEVPDADAFGDYGPDTEPHGEFSLEHVNFFGAAALRRLGRDAGLTLLATESNALATGVVSRLAAFRNDGRAGGATIEERSLTAESVLQYAERSSAAMVGVDDRLRQQAARGAAAVVWGAGSHSARLMRRSAFGAIAPVLVLDRNRNLAGRRLDGIPIAAPDALAAHPGVPVIVSSFNASAPIAAAIRARGVNPVVLLYG